MNYERIYVTAENGRIVKTDICRVSLELGDGQRYDDLEPHRLFPATKPDEYITLLNEEEKEIALIRNINELDKDSVKALNEVFSEYYLIPKITSVVKLEEYFGSLRWTVITDRGQITFRIKNRNNDIKKLRGTNRMIIRDANDNRYEIPDIGALDASSKRQLFPYT